MKILLYILILTSSISLCQNFDIKGNSVILNKGKISVKKRNVNIEKDANVNNSGTFYIEQVTPISSAMLNSEGNINNDNGNLILDYQGGTILNQNVIKGIVEYINPNSQSVPAVAYDSLIFKGGTKFLRPNDRTNKVDFEITNLMKSDSSVDIRAEDPNNVGQPRILANKNTEHNGTVNRNFSDGIQFILNTDSTYSQINGTGKFKSLEIDKSNGATITRGGWSIQNKLILRNGVLYNTDENGKNFTLEDGSVIQIIDGNFNVADEAGITRYPQSRINSAPNFEGKVLVEYTGTGPMEIGPEMPLSNNVLSDLIVNNSEGTTFTRDAYINDRLTLGSNIYMDNDTDKDGVNDKQNTLMYKGINSGIDFQKGDAEIYGNFARTNLTEGESQTFNNIYTWVEFGVNGQDLANNGGSIDTFLVRIEPNTGYKIEDYDEDAPLKVRRKMNLKAIDNTGTEVDKVNDVRYGYAWKHNPNNVNDPISETPVNSDINFSQMGLQKWDKDSVLWSDQIMLQENKIDTALNFAYSSAQLKGKLGDYAIGMTIAKYLAIMAKAVLEGPHKGNGVMTTTLRDSSILVDPTPPNEYPYNLDPMRANIVIDTFPAGVVDWVVLELRDGRNFANKKYYKTCFLTADGSVVDTNGSKQIIIYGEDTGLNVKAAGALYLAIRHRNHLAVVTEETIPYATKEAKVLIDFTDKAQVYLGNASVKVVGLDLDGKSIYGLVAGNVDRIEVTPVLNEQVINNADVDFIAKLISAWDLNPKNRYYRSDINMDGIITSRDYNYSWNNRGYVSVVE